MAVCVRSIYPEGEEEVECVDNIGDKVKFKAVASLFTMTLSHMKCEKVQLYVKAPDQIFLLKSNELENKEFIIAPIVIQS